MLSWAFLCRSRSEVGQKALEEGLGVDLHPSSPWGGLEWTVRAGACVVCSLRCAPRLGGGEHRVALSPVHPYSTGVKGGCVVVVGVTPRVCLGCAWPHVQSLYAFMTWVACASIHSTCCRTTLKDWGESGVSARGESSGVGAGVAA